MPGAVDAVIAAVEVDRLARPERAQQLDLLVEALAAGGERFVQGLVLDPVPARADTEAEAPAREDRHLRSLLRDERRLPLRQDDHAGGELELRRGGREEAVEHERLVEGIALRVGPAELRLAAGVLGAEHVVVDDQVRVAEPLGGLREVADRARVVADLAGRKHSPDSHDGVFSCARQPQSTEEERWADSRARWRS